VLDDLAGGRQASELSFSPSGRSLFFVGTSPTSDPAAYILDVRTRALTMIPLVAFGGNPASVTWTPDGQYLAFLLPTEPVELHIIRPDGTGERRLAVLPANVASAAGLSWVGSRASPAVAASR
jgi:dipeptidyl aminopeptidase/acylaminoacyl peptidase